MKSIVFFNDTATTEIYTLSLHDALPISIDHAAEIKNQELTGLDAALGRASVRLGAVRPGGHDRLEAHRGRAETTHLELEVERSEEHTFELQLRQYLVCRLLLEKKK